MSETIPDANPDDEDDGLTAVAEFGAVCAWYGSSHDGDHFVWIADGQAPEGPISDEEITGHLEAKRLAIVHSSFGPVNALPDRRALEMAWLSGAARTHAMTGAARLLAQGRRDEAAALLPEHRRVQLDGPGAERLLTTSLVGGSGVASTFDAGLSVHESAGALACLGHLLAHQSPMPDAQARAEAAAHAEKWLITRRR